MGDLKSFKVIPSGSKRKLNPTMWSCLLSSKKIKVALATTHIPLAEVTKNIKKAKLIEIIQILHSGLKNKT